MEEGQKSSGHDEDQADTGEGSRVDDAHRGGVALTASIVASIGEVFGGTSQAPEASVENSMSIGAKLAYAIQYLLHSQAVASARGAIGPVQAGAEFLFASAHVTRVASRAGEV